MSAETDSCNEDFAEDFLAKDNKNILFGRYRYIFNKKQLWIQHYI